MRGEEEGGDLALQLAALDGGAIAPRQPQPGKRPRHALLRRLPTIRDTQLSHRRTAEESRVTARERQRLARTEPGDPRSPSPSVGELSRDDDLARAAAAAERAYRSALALDPANGDVYFSLGNTLTDGAAKLEAFGAAVALRPDKLPAAINYAYELSRAGRHDETIAFWRPWARREPQAGARRLQARPQARGAAV